MTHRRVDRGLFLGRHFLMTGKHPLGKLPGLLVLVPVKPRRDVETLGCRKTETMDVGDENQERRQLLSGFLNAKFLRFFDGVDGVLANAGEPDEVGPRRLSLEQKRSQIRRSQWITHTTDDLAALALD